jgi:hypothetical protein
MEEQTKAHELWIPNKLRSANCDRGILNNAALYSFLPPRTQYRKRIVTINIDKIKILREYLLLGSVVATTHLSTIFSSFTYILWL